MKKIEAIVRKTHFEDVKQALFEADINWFSYSEVKAVGQDREDRIYRGVMYSTDVISRIEITIVCRDQFVEPSKKNADIIVPRLFTGSSELKVQAVLSVSAWVISIQSRILIS